MTPNTIPTNNHLQTVLFDLYQTVFPAVARYISKRGGSFTEAKDVFQDAVVIWFEKTETANQQTKDHKAYLMGIAKHLWIKSYQANQRYISLDELEPIGEDTDEFSHEPQTATLLSYLETAGRRCMELLKSFYYDKLNMTEIASTYGFSGERSATVQKFKCLEKVRETVKSKALTYEDFVE